MRETGILPDERSDTINFSTLPPPSLTAWHLLITCIFVKESMTPLKYFDMPQIKILENSLKEIGGGGGGNKLYFENWKLMELFLEFYGILFFDRCLRGKTQIDFSTYAEAISLTKPVGQNWRRKKAIGLTWYRDQMK